ncbi:MAG: pseudouridine synthase [Litoreibacter sp.]|uniref:pseudouridine synthase n=1 Tax=Litoreibacter sp. TaxID=1969459 RepID=UPI003298DFAF
MSRILLFNKPHGVLSQFTDGESRATLSDYINVPKVYAAGRLDRDSEGLLVLTDDGKLQAKIAHPKFKAAKTYMVQVEGVPEVGTLDQLREGVVLKDGKTRPAKVGAVPEPDWLWPRDPPVRVRKTVADSWLQMTINEGKNRQVRRMCAAVGHPCLRLIRVQVGEWSLAGIEQGQWRDA